MQSNLEDLMTYECTGCTNGIKMCYNRPCWGTPDEFRKIIDAGFAHKLMIDYWHGGEGQIPKIGKNPFPENVYFLCGSTPGNEGDITNLSPNGKCALLTDDNKCSVHEIKPIQGRTSCCKHTHAYDERIDLLRLWNSEDGKSLIEEWKLIVGLNKPTEAPEITMTSMLELLIGLGKKHEI